ncbi:uncharacterized protein LOC112348043 [Selaginella moellendorffii]|uniref:uncharacterized protein LOC112348043 n=1 Tax=Selaginella moellendorffii TaxID=88036 RepID=UPI000D1C8C5D|nr:uncharacterized protein LOC112348043 [Selaginella moellendorffii]XP_024535749.1 uncharacterized protein LOC112348043 [Selaginella moellendorffii]XP_024535750.1 uncharacterized protein LOC112348043 [Selaginella moellendorffii]|eukprot:XP_024535748.1 uncharacterized protein LOC112348043 [Selaginella moellendorffii]
MTQKGELFKGQKKKTAAANRHGKAPHVRKGKMFKEPKKKSAELEINKELAKFIDQANEAKAAAMATNEGSRLRVVKSSDDTSPAKPIKVHKNKKKNS